MRIYVWFFLVAVWSIAAVVYFIKRDVEGVRFSVIMAMLSMIMDSVKR